MSWRTDATPSSKEIDPRLVFERLFAAGTCCENAESAEKRRRYKQSILGMAFPVTIKSTSV
jgi:hypothetical protein